MKARRIIKRQITYPCYAKLKGLNSEIITIVKFVNNRNHGVVVEASKESNYEIGHEDIWMPIKNKTYWEILPDYKEGERVETTKIKAEKKVRLSNINPIW
jgi:hypothetical protein